MEAFVVMCAFPPMLGNGGNRAFELDESGDTSAHPVWSRPCYKSLGDRAAEATTDVEMQPNDFDETQDMELA